MSELHRDLGCPIPRATSERVLLGHGGGGRLTHDLVRTLFSAAFSNEILDRQHDSAVLAVPAVRRLAFTTDAFVVRPLIFPGGDLGSLAVHGTVNDLAMAGARPRELSAAFILEEGMPRATLEILVRSMASAARRCGVSIVTGDTKVVEAGKGDGVYVAMSGLGWIEHDLVIEPGSVREGDSILLSGDLGRHGMAVMAVREGLAFESTLKSDSCSIWDSVSALLTERVEVHCLRDVTRGGLAATLNEVAETRRAEVRIEEPTLPVIREVETACAVLGIDPWQVACEGRYLAIVPAAHAERALEVMRSVPCSAGACLIGQVGRIGQGHVVLRGALGVERSLPMPEGQPLPRIC